MDDTDTAKIELDKQEAREVINALSSYQTTVSGREEETALNIRELLQREFGFEDRHFDSDTSLDETFIDLFDDEKHFGKNEIRFSRNEAAEVVSALEESGSGPGSAEAGSIENLQDRFRETYELDAVT